MDYTSITVEEPRPREHTHFMQFDDLELIDPLLRAVTSEGYTEPTPIQLQSIPHVLEGKDLLGCAQTGTGKTAAFALPILQRLANSPARKAIRVLVLAPTRELATQIGESFTVYGRHLPFRQITIFGGVGQNPQVDALRRGADILIATPGRLLDLMGQGYVRFDQLDVLVLDEADRMLDMGFIHDVKRIIAALPKQRQTLLFSATMPEDIQELAHSILINPVYVEVTPQATTVEKIRQAVYFVERSEKRALLEYLLRDKSFKRTLVFTRTKHRANQLVKQLAQSSIHAEAIHGNKSQSARERALANFKSGATRVLVATDIAARGIDIDEITHVVNFDLPNESESYVHRIGRTARAGASGVAYSFCEEEERPYLVDIERLIRMRVPVIADHPYASRLGIPAPTDLNQKPSRRYNQAAQKKLAPAIGREPQPQRPQALPGSQRPSTPNSQRPAPANGQRPAGASNQQPNGDAPAKRRRRRRKPMSQRVTE
jgi:ATP-dependent RNA helicase RhlE